MHTEATTHRFNSADDLHKTLHRYVWLYNEQLPQKALGHIAPIEALKRWRTSHAHLFNKSVSNRPEPDTNGYDDGCAAISGSNGEKPATANCVVAGVSVRDAWNTSKSAHGLWRISQTLALTLALPRRTFLVMGLPELAA